MKYAKITVNQSQCSQTKNTSKPVGTLKLNGPKFLISTIIKKMILEDNPVFSMSIMRQKNTLKGTVIFIVRPEMYNSNIFLI